MKTILISDNTTPPLRLLETGISVLQVDTVAAMREGIAHFIYMKKDGTQREAFGTLEPNQLAAVMTSEQYQKVVRENVNPNVQSYYDLIAKDWRMYSTANLIALL